MSYPLRSCHRCGKGFFSSYEEHICQDCLKDLGWEPTPYSNAQHIRSMTDEELAEWMENNNVDCHACSEYERCGGDVVFNKPCDQKCAKHYLDWLKQPYKEDT